MAGGLPAVTIALLAAAGSPDFASDCTQISVGKTPLNDLGTGTYQGQQGGLYPGGSNTRPAVHDRDLDRIGRVELEIDSLPEGARRLHVLGEAVVETRVLPSFVSCAPWRSSRS